MNRKLFKWILFIIFTFWLICLQWEQTENISYLTNLHSAKRGLLGNRFLNLVHIGFVDYLTSLFWPYL
jgi:hypothetical protein